MSSGDVGTSMDQDSQEAHALPLMPFVEDYLPALLAQASKLISAEFHTVVESEGFSITEWRILASLTGTSGISTGRLAQISVSKQPTVTRLLDRMEAKGYVERFAHDTDRRLTMVRIAPAGQTIVADLIRKAKEHELRVLQPFGLKRAEALKVTLRRIIELHLPPG
ncbi:MarR family winged helix-turn-helix transcriptional regulator [Comamonas thiooxydans]|uniref:MarR family winged helix-turn-helix transcriptional regulator n=2 Tax=Comamonas thiooxydans TaxID=363952 RepID=UPI0001BB0DFB|nr:MarR family transcriptional regulator [Comamonas thiooxydans]ACY30750.1 transcriptional regulator, MarR family [Comamonas thiooxydans]MDO1472212.1 MarR family transcriptional regulator [Comamonas thiooxydans]